jgi:hypothetical protein
VLSVDPERERISLGLKQLDRDPFSNFVAEHTEGQYRVNGTVKEVDAKAAVIELADGIDGILRAADISQRSRRRCSHRAECRGQRRGEVHGCRQEDPRDQLVHQGQGLSGRGRDGARLQQFGASATTSLGALLKEKMRGQDGLSGLSALRGAHAEMGPPVTVPLPVAFGFRRQTVAVNRQGCTRRPNRMHVKAGASGNFGNRWRGGPVPPFRRSSRFERTTRNEGGVP